MNPTEQLQAALDSLKDADGIQISFTWTKGIIGLWVIDKSNGNKVIWYDSAVRLTEVIDKLILSIGEIAR